MAFAISSSWSTFLSSSSRSHSFCSINYSFSSSVKGYYSSNIHSNKSKSKIKHSPLLLIQNKTTTSFFICGAAAEYKFPDPIPDFADQEIEKFRSHLLKKLSKKAIFGDSVQQVVEICTEIFGTFLHVEYGGPGTLLVIPFIDMADALNERGLPGGPQAARAAVKWAQAHVDKDWKEWTGSD